MFELAVLFFQLLEATNLRHPQADKEVANLMSVLRAMSEVGLTSVKTDLERLQAERADLAAEPDQIADRKRKLKGLDEAGEKYLNA